jgi:hypothetical protein
VGRLVRKQTVLSHRGYERVPARSLDWRQEAGRQHPMLPLPKDRCESKGVLWGLGLQPVHRCAEKWRLLRNVMRQGLFQLDPSSH